MIIYPILYSIIAFLLTYIAFDVYMVKIAIKREVFKELNNLLDDDTADVEVVESEDSLVTVVNLHVTRSTSRIFELDRERIVTTSRIKINSIVALILIVVAILI